LSPTRSVTDHHAAWVKHNGSLCGAVALVAGWVLAPFGNAVRRLAVVALVKVRTQPSMTNSRDDWRD
jgi:hypothetical protein